MESQHPREHVENMLLLKPPHTTKAVAASLYDDVVISVASDATPPSAKDSDAQWVHSLREIYPPPPPPVPPPVPPPPARWFLWTINPESVASLEIPPAALFLLWVFWCRFPRPKCVSVFDRRRDVDSVWRCFCNDVWPFGS